MLIFTQNYLKTVVKNAFGLGENMIIKNVFTGPNNHLCKKIVELHLQRYKDLRNLYSTIFFFF